MLVAIQSNTKRYLNLFCEVIDRMMPDPDRDISEKDDVLDVIRHQRLERNELNEQRALDRLGVDSGVVQLMLIETGTHYLVDTARIRSRGGLLGIYDARPEHLLRPPLQDYARRLLGLSR